MTDEEINELIDLRDAIDTVLVYISDNSCGDPECCGGPYYSDEEFIIAKDVVENYRGDRLEENEMLREMMKIHPMETAPRNGELVILFPKFDDPILVGVFDKYIWHCADQYQEERGEFGFTGCVQVDANLRGWMPLPSAALGETE